MEKVFIETIRVEEGHFCNLPLHRERFRRTMQAFFCKELDITLTDDWIPQTYATGVFKCRILYSDHIHSVEYIPYTLRTVRTIRLVENNEIEYRYKSANRYLLNKLLAASGCDEILIVKNALLTDTSFSNIILEDERGGLFTPDSYLLQGTKREQLLRQGIIKELRIGGDELTNYKKIHLINAMIGVNELCFGVDEIII